MHLSGLRMAQAALETPSVGNASLGVHAQAFSHAYHALYSLLVTVGEHLGANHCVNWGALQDGHPLLAGMA